MPVLLIGVAIGAVIGGSGVWLASDAAQKVGNAALIGGGIYLAGKYMKKW
ncbi:hypothetical protein [Thalassospira marina]|nr:hypothetical protein [Thalassospira marina]